jgi:hypothetical protein
MNPIAFDVRLTVEDYVAAVQFHARHSSWVVRYWMVEVLAIAAGAFAIGSRASLKLATIDFMLMLIVMGVPLWVSLEYWVPRRARRTYAQHRPLQDPHRYEFTEREVRSSGVMGEVKIPWDYFRKFTEWPEGFLIYMSDTSFLIIPERFIPSLPQFREMLSLNVGRRPAVS